MKPSKVSKQRRLNRGRNADYVSSLGGFSIGRMTLQQKKEAKKKYQMKVGKRRR